MVKKFSVDWLAQSIHDQAPPAAPERRRPHVPCVVQPRAPTSYDRLLLQPKAKRKDAAAARRSCSSPSCTRAPGFLSTRVENAHPARSVPESGGYSSGYESEAAASVEDASDGAARRIRTKFTPEQIDKLEKIFSKHKYLDAGERVKTALRLNLSETQVRTWFQNRRMKLKREVQEMRADYLLPQMVLPVQFNCYEPQRLPFPTLAHHQRVMPHLPPPPHHRHLLVMPRAQYY